MEAAIADIDAEIIVIDNNSPDDSCDMVKELFPSVKLIENKDNSGFSKGNNIGVAQAKGEYLCILNPDTVVAEDTFSKLLNFTELKDNLGIVGCQLIDGKGKFLPESKRNIPTPKVSLRKVLGNTNDYYANHVSIEETAKVDILVGAFMWLKKDVYEAVGGFDEAYFMYGEDIDLSYKVIKAGYDNFYFGETTVVHFKGESTLKDSKYAKRFYGAMQIFYKKHFKQNLLFNAVVWVGIKMAHILRKNPVDVEIKSNQSYLYSVDFDPVLVEQLPKPTQIENTIQDIIKNNSLIVYDFKILIASIVIADMKQKSKQENIGFRFLLKNSKFILGSDSAINRGEVLHF
ncbi:dTDP-Rha:A-D-GlcNAc-diphosphoryl polyprenol, A-3-L-rhamnosyl transferase WbbL [Winogradskyella psychrotolerans RS-3]|uniref:dTDP-Rha:A-D-GlcNAc-diphosphoryl polyprenol, A-3-L-rhamnosyl transferase WbbL n=1 Tax=Winogradskyella psychrotolerans RS-3 TaxID=641526 RepID=S7VPX0_9FLAO|nr:dTDP-Rha:A-D-GlcNAc-diphosphoryl polyprenol, A-3-L-rhamnosyl transferase WbbL [Winogradskyella psychrotolerans RS-3]